MTSKKRIVRAANVAAVVLIFVTAGLQHARGQNCGTCTGSGCASAMFPITVYCYGSNCSGMATVYEPEGYGQYFFYAVAECCCGELECSAPWNGMYCVAPVRQGRAAAGELEEMDAPTYVFVRGCDGIYRLEVVAS